MTGTIISIEYNYMSGDWIYVNIIIMPNPDDGVPIDDIYCGFYVKNEEDMPNIYDDVDLFYHDKDKQYYVALEGYWYESMF